MVDVLIKLIHNTTFLTVISGIFVFILSQYFLELVINPIKEYKRIKNKIGFSMTMYACYYSNPYNYDKKDNFEEIKVYKGVASELRVVGSELSGYIATIPQFRKRKIKKLNDVKKYLIGLSNGLFVHNNSNDIISQNIKFYQKIEKILKLNDK